jgi:hypothetical protein
MEDILGKIGRSKQVLNNKAEHEWRLKMSKKAVIFVSVFLSIFVIAVYQCPPQAPEDGTKFLEAGMRKVYSDPESRKKAELMVWDVPSAFAGSKDLQETTNRMSKL